MDEVEAALDEVNLARLVELLTELRDSSQLIIITHQQFTMESADALYGASTQRAVLNFPISGRRFPRGFIRALALVKVAAAETNAPARPDNARGLRGWSGCS